MAIRHAIEHTREFASDIWQKGASEELNEATPRQKAVLGAAACTLAIEWGTGDLAIIGALGGHVLRSTHNVVDTMVTAGGISAAEQSVFGLAMVAAIHNFPRTMDAIRIRKNREEATITTPEVGSRASALETPSAATETTTDKQKQSFGNRFLTAFSIGTSLKALFVDSSKEKRSATRDARTVLEDSVLIGGGVAGVAAAAAGATNLGRAVGAEQAANIFVTIISNPLTWLGVFGLKQQASIRKFFSADNGSIPEADASQPLL